MQRHYIIPPRHASTANIRSLIAIYGDQQNEVIKGGQEDKDLSVPCSSFAPCVRPSFSTVDMRLFIYLSNLQRFGFILTRTRKGTLLGTRPPLSDPVMQ